MQAQVARGVWQGNALVARAGAGKECPAWWPGQVQAWRSHLGGQGWHVPQEEEEQLPVRSLERGDEELLRAHLEVLGVLWATTTHRSGHGYQRVKGRSKTELYIGALWRVSSYNPVSVRLRLTGLAHTPSHVSCLPLRSSSTTSSSYDSIRNRRTVNQFSS